MLNAFRLAVASDGTIWLEGEYGLCRFDGAACEPPPELPAFMTGASLVLDVAPDGALWVGSEQGASRFDGISWTGRLLGVGVSDLDAGYPGEVWAATSQGVARHGESDDVWLFYAEEQGLPGHQIWTVGVSPDGAVWAHVAWEGLYRFDGEGWQAVEDPPGGIVRDIAFAADGTPWVGTVGSTHYPGGALSRWTGDAWDDVSSGSGLISFRAVAPGQDGVVAAATSLGLGLFQDGEWRMLRDGPTSSRVASVAVTPDGAAWFAFGDQSLSTSGRGLSRFDGEEWQYHLGDAEVTALAVAPDGSLWAGVGCSIRRFDGVTWETLARCDEELPVGNVIDIEFAAGGSAWVAMGLNLVRFDGEVWIPYDRLVHEVVAAPDDGIWVNGWEGTEGSQYVARLDEQDWAVFHLSESVPGAFAASAVTPDGRVWGVVAERGLAAFDGQGWSEPESWAFDGLPEGLTFRGAGPALAPDGSLWMRLEHGLARFDPALAVAEGAWTVYSLEQGVEDGYGPLAFGPDGEIWVGATRLEPGAGSR
jgi:ligand-binding sensor domain-containing protein